MKPYAPGKSMRSFIDWTVRVATVSEPERCEIKYDYWFAGALAGFLFALLIT